MCFLLVETLGRHGDCFQTEVMDREHLDKLLSVKVSSCSFRVLEQKPPDVAVRVAERDEHRTAVWMGPVVYKAGTGERVFSLSDRTLGFWIQL